MPYNSLISRTDATSLIPVPVADEIIKAMPQSSAVLTLGRRLPNLAHGQQRIPVMSALASAYFVTGDTGLKQTTEVTWADKYLNVEELAAIVPIPEAVLDDAAYDIWGEVKPSIAEAMGRTFDMAVLYGTNAPSNWPTDLHNACITASQAVTIGSVGDDLYDDLLGEGGVIAKVEADGYLPTGHIAATSMRAKLRGVRSDDKMPIFQRTMQDRARYDLDGSPCLFPLNGAMDADTTLLFTGDWTQLVWAMRQDISYKILTEGVIQDSNGDIQYNLAQQDMVALRAVMRLAWQCPNPITRMNNDDDTRFPFATLLPAE